ncbi:MAG: tyrosine-type recombinase/integrase [Rhodococcus sp. (in: high G+C Gram-positive bacteria)]
MSIHERVSTRRDPATGAKVERRDANGKPIKTFEVRFRAPDGRERSRSFKTITEAKRYEREQLVERDRGTWVDPRSGRMTLNEWAEQWQKTLVHLRPNSRRIYSDNLRLHVLPKVGDVELGPIRLTSITTEVARAWLSALSTKRIGRNFDPLIGERGRVLAPATVHQAYRTLNTVLQAAVECDRIVRNPMTGVKPPKVEQMPMRFLLPVEVVRLADEIGPEYRAMVLVAALCGLRASELAGLQWDDIQMLERRIDVSRQLDSGTGMLVPPKTKASRRSIHMPGLVTDALGLHAEIGNGQDATRGSGGFVFAAPEGGPLDLHNWRSRVWVPAVKRAGLDPLRLHDLRHTCASLAIAAGADVKVLQRLLGHTSAAMTLDRYGHLMPGQSEAVADRLDALVARETKSARVG